MKRKHLCSPIKALFILVTATLAAALNAGFAPAQTACPSGVAAGSAACLPDGDGGGGGRDYPTGRWIKTWGAFVSSNSAHGAWTSTQAFSKQEAVDVALRKCRQMTGANDCIVDVTYFNQCAAVAGVPKGVGVYSNTGKDESIAKARAVTYCQKETGKKCEAMFAECSDPVFEKF